MSRITLPSGTPAVLALPDGVPTRGVVVAPDINGLRDLYDAVAADLAARHGWAVCVVELFPGREHLSWDERMETPLDVDRVVADLVEGADATGADPVAVIGFCRGGLHVYQAAASGRFDRGVSFYGMIRIPPEWAPGKGEPLETLARPEACPVLSIVGGRDPYTPPDDVEALRQLPNVEVVVYPEADHGFVHQPHAASHRPDDAADAWERTARFLALG